VVAYGTDVSSWTDIVQVAAGEAHTVGVKSDGTVVVAGYNRWGQLNVGSWTDIRFGSGCNSDIYRCGAPSSSLNF
jgi:alpha-tubulin suppressor-like RCC1 family protein